MSMIHHPEMEKHDRTMLEIVDIWREVKLLNDKVILITGGTGSFGTKCTEVILKRYAPKKLIIFSRDELKQFDMAQKYSQRIPLYALFYWRCTR